MFCAHIAQDRISTVLCDSIAFTVYCRYNSIYCEYNSVNGSYISVCIDLLNSLCNNCALQVQLWAEEFQSDHHHKAHVSHCGRTHSAEHMLEQEKAREKGPCGPVLGPTHIPARICSQHGSTPPIRGHVSGSSDNGTVLSGCCSSVW